MARRLVVAIDGPAGAGKSTVARAVAVRLGYTYVDTGAMYRAVALTALERGIPPDDQERLGELAESLHIQLTSGPDGEVRVYRDGEDVTARIREPDVDAVVAVVASAPGVRRALARLQREMSAQGGVVVDGRDIGSDVLPDADCKVFLTASLEERVARRRQQLLRRGLDVDPAEVEKAIVQRDRLDRERAHNPLRVAEDAVVLDTTGMAVAEVVERVTQLCRGKGC
ncbi:MAG: (d)CMP kinase [Clostridia bacterium]|nr:(d)CMP kinase [Clostridia bacterium]